MSSQFKLSHAFSVLRLLEQFCAFFLYFLEEPPNLGDHSVQYYRCRYDFAKLTFSTVTSRRNGLQANGDC